MVTCYVDLHGVDETGLGKNGISLYCRQLTSYNKPTVTAVGTGEEGQRIIRGSEPIQLSFLQNFCDGNCVRIKLAGHILKFYDVS